MIKHAWKFLMAGAVVVLGACGGDGGTGPTFSDSVSTVDAQDFASDANSFAGNIASAIDFSGPSIGFSAPASVQRMVDRGELPALVGGRSLTAMVPRFDGLALVRAGGLQASAAEGCTLTTRGTLNGTSGFVDVNQNGLADDLYILLDCTYTDSTSNPDTTFIAKQLIEQHLTENFGALWGFTMTLRYNVSERDQFGNGVGIVVTAGETLDIRGSSAGHRANIDVKVAQDSATVHRRYAGGDGWNGAFTPTGSIVLGAPAPSGAIDFTARSWFTDTESINLSFSMATTTPLAYSAPCAAGASPHFTGGVIEGRLNNSASLASFTVTYTACGVAPTVVTTGTS